MTGHMFVEQVGKCRGILTACRILLKALLAGLIHVRRIEIGKVFLHVIFRELRDQGGVCSGSVLDPTLKMVLNIYHYEIIKYSAFHVVIVFTNAGLRHT